MFVDKNFAKKLLKSLTPPIMLDAAKVGYHYCKYSSGKRLFNGDDEVFKKVLSTGTVYGEYGCGASTIWVAKNTKCKILSVDGSSEWVDRINKKCLKYAGVVVHLADLGVVKAWGRPAGYDLEENFSVYTDWIWLHNEKPDVVLVDGRFRVCSFLTSLLQAESGTKIIFDDYVNRQHYHFVERFISPVAFCGRQALFIVPPKQLLKVDDLVDSINKFRYVFD